MSKLIDAIEAHQTGKRFPKHTGPLRYSDMIVIDAKAMELTPYLVEYRIEVRLGANVRWEPGRDNEPALRNMARMLENHVFGEFRDDIDKIHRALYQNDYDSAVACLEEMRKRMFSA